MDVHPPKGLGKCWDGAPHLHEGLGVGKGVNGHGAWFVKMVWGIGG